MIYVAIASLPAADRAEHETLAALPQDTPEQGNAKARALFEFYDRHPGLDAVHWQVRANDLGGIVETFRDRERTYQRVRNGEWRADVLDLGDEGWT